MEGGKKTKDPWRETLRWLRFAVVWLRGRARHLKIDMKVPISLELCRPVSPLPTPSYRKALESRLPHALVSARPSVSDLPNGRRLDVAAHPIPKFPQSSRQGRPRPHPTCFPRSPRPPPFRLPQKGKKGSPIPLRPAFPASLPQSLLPASPVQVHELPCPKERAPNAHTEEPRPVSRFLLIEPSCPTLRKTGRERERNKSRPSPSPTHNNRTTTSIALFLHSNCCLAR